jgi:hypothetical protein
VSLAGRVGLGSSDKMRAMLPCPHYQVPVVAAMATAGDGPDHLNTPRRITSASTNAIVWRDTAARIEGSRMRQRAFMLLLSMLAFRTASGATDCSGIDRTLADDVKASLAPVVATQLHTAGVDILQSFKSHDRDM